MTTDQMRAARWFGCCLLAAGGCAGASSPGGQEPLRVGTTGDFAPFSIAIPSGYVGVDIDLARDLAQELGRPVEFVVTNWTSLEADAANHRFDLAMSGISVTAPRALEVDFSRPYSEHYRVAIVRCAEAHRFLSFADLDQDGVTVVIPAGGAVASYTRGRLLSATVRESDRMTTAYRDLVSGTGDAIISTPYTYRRYRGLCLGLAGHRFYSTPVAVMLPKGSPLVEAVNAWVTRRLADGTVAGLFNHYQPP